jgi:protein-arginine kinase activator protein McsA
VLKGMKETLTPKLPVSQRAELKARLAQAIKQENYELAAILRDELKSIDVKKPE